MSDEQAISQWRRLDERITTSGQPSEAQLAAVADLGVTHIINLGLHTHARALPDERASVEAFGMHYIHIPVDFEAPSEEDYARFCAAMDGLGGALVHVHCIVNARVSAFLYRYRRERLGVDERSARSEMETIWRPGGVWARFVGDEARANAPHLYAGRDY